jgi:hypothetical protein
VQVDPDILARAKIFAVSRHRILEVEAPPRDWQRRSLALPNRCIRVPAVTFSRLERA